MTGEGNEILGSSTRPTMASVGRQRREDDAKDKVRPDNSRQEKDDADDDGEDRGHRFTG